MSITTRVATGEETISLVTRPPATDPLASARAIIREILRDADARRRARTDQRVRVLVLAQTLPTWGSIAPIVAALARREDATVTVVALDDPAARTAHAPGTVAAVLADQGIAAVSVGDVVVRLACDDPDAAFDVALLCDPYDELRPAVLTMQSLLEHGLRIAYSPYAENIGGEVDLHYNATLHNLAWRVFVPDETQRTLYARHCAAGAGHVRALGSVKADWLQAGDAAAHRAGAAIRRRLATRTVALWNPHFRRGPGGWSTFERYVNDVLGFAARHPRTGILVRPHFRLLPDLEAAPGGAGFVAAFRRECAALANVMIDESTDYRPAFAASDALVSDLSSLIPEYLRLGRPVAYLRHPNPPATVADDAWLPDVTVLDDAAALAAYLRGVVRHRAAPAPILLPGTGAGERVAAAIVEDFRRDVLTAGSTP